MSGQMYQPAPQVQSGITQELRQSVIRYFNEELRHFHEVNKTGEQLEAIVFEKHSATAQTYNEYVGRMLQAFRQKRRANMQQTSQQPQQSAPPPQMQHAQPADPLTSLQHLAARQPGASAGVAPRPMHQVNVAPTPTTVNVNPVGVSNMNQNRFISPAKTYTIQGQQMQPRGMSVPVSMMQQQQQQQQQQTQMVQQQVASPAMAAPSPAAPPVPSPAQVHSVAGPSSVLPTTTSSSAPQDDMATMKEQVARLTAQYKEPLRNKLATLDRNSREYSKCAKVYNYLCESRPLMKLQNPTQVEQLHQILRQMVHLGPSSQPADGVEAACNTLTRTVEELLGVHDRTVVLRALKRTAQEALHDDLLQEWLPGSKKCSNVIDTPTSNNSVARGESLSLSIDAVLDREPALKQPCFRVKRGVELEDNELGEIIVEGDLIPEGSENSVPKQLLASYHHDHISYKIPTLVLELPVDYPSQSLQHAVQVRKLIGDRDDNSEEEKDEDFSKNFLLQLKVELEVLKRTGNLWTVSSVLTGLKKVVLKCLVDELQND